MLPSTAEPWNLLITGVGGMGVITLGALIGMAAHLDGKGVSTLDMTGLAQKFGAVFSHLRIADRQEDIHAARIATGEAHAVLGGDLVVTAGNEALSKMLEGRTRTVVNCTETPTADFTRNPDWEFPLNRMQKAIADTVGAGGADFLDAQHLATRLMGDALYTNMLLLGYAWQKGLVPVSRIALERSIELNGAAVQANLAAFAWGRRMAVSPDAVLALAGVRELPGVEATPGLDELIDRHVQHLTAYQDQKLAECYRHLVEKVRLLGDEGLTTAVAASYGKLLAIKDEYEVARLYAQTDFMDRLKETFEGDFRLRFHLAPPGIARPGPDGRPRKIAFGPWMFTAFSWLAKLRRLRGTVFDPFGRSEERRFERQLIADYEADVALILEKAAGNPQAARELAAWPEGVRGFGPVKRQTARPALEKRSILRQRLMA